MPLEGSGAAASGAPVAGSTAGAPVAGSTGAGVAVEPVTVVVPGAGAVGAVEVSAGGASPEPPPMLLMKKKTAPSSSTPITAACAIGFEFSFSLIGLCSVRHPDGEP